MNERFLQDVLFTLNWYKDLAERALAQLSDEQLHWKPDADGNSVAILVQHLAGNMRSRWTDFLTTDGEKPDRNRDGEFEEAIRTREELVATWEAGWRCVLDAIGGLAPGDLAKSVTIRGREHTVVQAILRQLTHYAYHVGQIVYVARMQRADEWESLSIARGRSESYVPKGRL